jgi:hypothetical protein
MLHAGPNSLHHKTQCTRTPTWTLRTCHKDKEEDEDEEEENINIPEAP